MAQIDNGENTFADLIIKGKSKKATPINDELIKTSDELWNDY